MGHRIRQVMRPSRWRGRFGQSLWAVSMLVALAGPAALDAADDEAPEFSFGGRKVDVKRSWVAEPYAPDPAPAALPAPPQLLAPPEPSAVDQPEPPPPATNLATPALSSGPAAQRADLIPTQSTEGGAARADAHIVPGTTPTVLPVSRSEPQLIAPAAPAPLIVYQPMAVPAGVPTGAAPPGESSLANTIALVAAGFAAGVALALSLMLLPVAIALRRNSSPSGEPTRNVPERREADSTRRNRTANVAPEHGRPLEHRQPAETLGQRLERERAEDEAESQRQAAALFAHVLDENLNLQDQLRQADETE